MFATTARRKKSRSFLLLGWTPREVGPIARMLLEHQMTKELAVAAKMEQPAKEYPQSGNTDALMADIKSYVDHVTLHLAKENHRLFVMPDMVLQCRAEQINSDLTRSTGSELKEPGRRRAHYEKLVSNVESGPLS
jgi:hemerythrin-like domain-containing protein